MKINFFFAGIVFFLPFNKSVAQYSPSLLTAHKGLLNVIGYSQIKVMPDVVELVFRIEKKDVLSEKAIEFLHVELNDLKLFFQKNNFDTSQIRISQYTVSVRRDYNTQDNITCANAALNVKFSYNRKLISMLVNDIQAKKMRDVSFDFSYSLSSVLENKIMDSLNTLAIKNAQNTALKICNNMDLNIIGVKNIATKTQNNIYEQSFNLNASIKKKSPLILTKDKTEAISDEVFNHYEVEEILRDTQIDITYEVVSSLMQ